MTPRSVSETVSVSPLSQPKFIVGWRNSTSFASVPMWDQEPSFFTKLIRIVDNFGSSRYRKCMFAYFCHSPTVIRTLFCRLVSSSVYGNGAVKPYVISCRNLRFVVSLKLKHSDPVILPQTIRPCNNGRHRECQSVIHS